MSFTEKLSTINAFFTTNPFSYTLQPPLMPYSPVDAFLFDNQQGFCSHYASALTYMLRLADVPARLVAGYQGGEQQGDNILTIRQFDAHAWVEAYDKEKGWLRFDPTSLVAPNRALSGIMSALNNEDSAIFEEGVGGLFAHSAFDNIRGMLAVLDHSWSQIVLEFNNDSQGSLIEDIFGELSKKNLTTFLLIALAFIGLFLAALFLPYRKWLSIKRNTALQKVLKLLHKKGFTRAKNEPLQRFFNRIESTLPDNLKAAVEDFVEQYYEHKYKANTLVTEDDLLSSYIKIAAKKNQSR